MTRFFAYAVATALILTTGPVARAQQDPGARAAGGGYIPSTHSPGCGGLMCDSDDPRRAAGAPPPPPCQGLLCSVSPYSMAPPVTAADVARIQEERARAAATAPPPEPATRSHKRRKAKTARKADKAKSVATRTPDPGTAGSDAR